jgi:hypothetical protein
VWSVDGTQEICKRNFIKAWSWEGIIGDDTDNSRGNFDNDVQRRMFPSHWWNCLSSLMSFSGFATWLVASPHQSVVAESLDRRRKAPPPLVLNGLSRFFLPSLPLSPFRRLSFFWPSLCLFLPSFRLLVPTLTNPGHVHI